MKRQESQRVDHLRKEIKGEGSKDWKRRVNRGLSYTHNGGEWYFVLFCFLGEWFNSISKGQIQYD